MTADTTVPAFDRFLAWATDHRFPVASRYLWVTASIMLVALIRALLITDLVPWLLFVPMILLVPLFLGQGPGLYAGVLGAVLAAVTIGSSRNPWWLTGQQWAGTALFLVVAFVVVKVSAGLRASLIRARALNARLIEREAFLTGVLASSTDCITVLDRDARLTFMTEGSMRVTEISDFTQIEGRTWTDFWKGEGHAEAKAAIAVALGGQPGHFTAAADTYLGTPRWWDVSVSPIFDDSGNVDRILAVARDVTEGMRVHAQQELLNGELNHRLKNVLALVQSIAGQTLRQADSLEEASAAFTARLVALGKAADVLTATSWQAVTVREVVEAAAESFTDCRDRVRIAGGRVELSARVGLAMTLAMHELLTNACKYGALSNEDGVVDLTWATRTDADGAERFGLVWNESGGPRVEEPTRRGFGTRMLERSLAAYFRGQTAITYRPEGVQFRIDAPLAAAGARVGE